MNEEESLYTIGLLKKMEKSHVINSVYVTSVLIPSLAIYPLDKIVTYTGQKFWMWSHRFSHST